MAKKPERRYQSMQELREDLLDLEARIGKTELDAEARAARTPDPGEVSASVDGTALSTELSLASMRPRRWPMYAAAVLPIVLVSAALLSRFKAPSVRGRVATEHVESELEAPPPSPLRPAAPAGTLPPEASESTAKLAAQPSAPEQDEAPPPVEVLLGVAPTTSHVFLGDRDLGRSPVSIDVPKGELVTVEVRNPGYETRLLQLDGSEARKSIELKKKKKKRNKAGVVVEVPASLDAEPPRQTSPTPAEIGGQLFVEPWQKPSD
jgi:hypothetical protein